MLVNNFSHHNNSFIPPKYAFFMRRNRGIVEVKFTERGTAALVDGVRVELDQLRDASWFIMSKGRQPSKQRVLAIAERAPYQADAFSFNRNHPMKVLLRTHERWIEYFVIREILGMRAGFADLVDPNGPLSRENLGEKTQGVLRDYERQGYTIFLRRHIEGVNTYARNQEHIDRVVKAGPIPLTQRVWS